MVFEYGMGNDLIPNKDDASKILQQCFDDISDILKTMQKPLYSISKQIFIYEYIDMKKTKDVFEDLKKESEGVI